MNKIIFIDTKRNFHAQRAFERRLRAYHQAPGDFRPKRFALTCVWRVDPDTGRLVASWSLEAVDDLTHCPHKLHFSKRAAEVARARAA